MFLNGFRNQIELRSNVSLQSSPHERIDAVRAVPLLRFDRDKRWETLLTEIIRRHCHQNAQDLDSSIVVFRDLKEACPEIPVVIDRF